MKPRRLLACKFDLVVNLTTAKALAPPALHAHADEGIE
jgi:hypothetical protein